MLERAIALQGVFVLDLRDGGEDRGEQNGDGARFAERGDGDGDVDGDASPRKPEKGGMFLGQIRRPDKAAAHRQLKTHLAIMGAVIAVIRATPYVLHLLSKEKEELRLEL
ncbi:hypothetical protein Taro_002279 [Colocasia esculenta]|uniref:Uncharacterized protein n=1 Tax=Colocasia esculenta TaxID=4460 RepID=A0A843TIN8_COLES|nr:hypothetical protein [Colocasia esculenta]